MKITYANKKKVKYLKKSSMIKISIIVLKYFPKIDYYSL